ncbi:MAG: HD domain-containing protein [Acidobacteriota bacterium]|nr:HD domain-containing protein [Acidobacteriota bacterium]
MFVRELTDGSNVDQVLLVRRVERREGRAGQPFLRVTFGDRTGAVRGMVWDDVQETAELLSEGEPIRLRGRYEVHAEYGPQIRIFALTAPASADVVMADLVESAVRSAEAMEGELRALLETVANEDLRALLDRFLAPDAECWARYRVAPAAKHYHQAYRHGLLEHSLSVAQAVGAVATTFPGIDRDVAVTGALLHDIGKLDTYAEHGSRFEMTDLGRLHGEIPLGYFRVRRTIESMEGFPDDLAQAVLHIILSHHGTLENGSPVVPCTREATLVHMIDNLGGRLGSFDRLERELAPGRLWSDFDRAIGGAAYFGPQERAPQGGRAEASPGGEGERVHRPEPLAAGLAAA